MKVLVIGSGGREHAIAYSLVKSPKVTELHALPGNPGISKIGKSMPAGPALKQPPFWLVKVLPSPSSKNPPPS